MATQASYLRANDREANYGTNEQFPRKRSTWRSTIGRFRVYVLAKLTKLPLSSLFQIVWKHVGDRFLWLGTFKSYLLHIWPVSLIVRLLFAIRILLVIFQPINSIFVVYQGAKVTHVFFQISRSNKDTLDPRKDLCILILSGIFEICLDALQKPLWSRIAQPCRLGFSDESFNYTSRLGPSWQNKRSPSEKSTIIGKSRGPDKYINATLFGVLPALIELLLAVGGALHRIGYSHAALLASNLVINIMITIWSTGRTAILERAKVDAKYRIVSVRGEYVGSFQTLQNFQRENAAAKHHVKVMCDSHNQDNKHVDRSCKVDVFQQVVYFVILGTMMLQTVPGLRTGQYNAVDIMALYAIALKLRKRSSAIADCVQEAQSAEKGDKRRQDLALEEPLVVDLPDASELLTCSGDIEFTNVVFSYTELQILKGATFTCQPKETVAIVGQSGAGKSTILDLLWRHMDVYRGSISIDGRDIRSLKANTLRRHISVVPQNPVLFNQTLLENLRFAKDGISEAEVRGKVRALGFEDIFDRIGYSKIIGDRGSGISGGQRAMVAIAMAAIKETPILLLDEATAALDPKSEKIVQKAIEKLKVSKTIVMIAHRETTVSHADRVYWLRNGKLSGGMKHECFLEKDKAYASFWE